jgi:hypothetical protein
MRPTFRSLTAIAVILAFCTLTALPAFAAITLNGTAPVSAAGIVVIQPNKLLTTHGVLKFKFSAPTAGAYTMGFCIGTTPNTCGQAASYVVQVPGGEERLAVVDAATFADKALVVVQPTNKALPFSVTIE